ncbi:Uncharacterised protein [Acetobacterium wieringae]|uniref:major capsid protein n=1 Tax=Acetobacterium wieringae TaxID=52694 RepID=UPI001D6AA5E6|nr:major capsid protein [Acetobacterium wieringae]VUZ28528.1 Uncharacterised protein [Acetobacterium wieringae]
MDILKLISKKDLLDFSQNLSVTRNYLGDRLFPDIKTQNLKAEFYRLTDPRRIPKMAKVHSFDTEAAIGTRPDLEKVEFEKLLIKEKINQSEEVQILKDQGVAENALISYIYDDMGRMAENVKTRTEVMKMELLQSGKIKVKENGLDFAIDYGVPAGNKKSYNWSAVDHDVLADIKEMVKIAKNKGYTISKVITSDEVASKLQANKGIQTLINSALGVGAFVSVEQLNVLFNSIFKFTIELNDDLYSYEGANGALVEKRYIEENKFVLVPTLTNGTAGTGLWGVTAEEKLLGPWSAKSAKQFISINQWETPDPPNVWTKAAGVFIPVMPNSNGLVIGTITLA